MADSLETLEQQRAEILRQMQQLGDMRRGSVVEQYLRCGKSPCCCKRPGHPGHGPYFALTCKVAGKTKTRQLRAGPVLERSRQDGAFGFGGAGTGPALLDASDRRSAAGEIAELRRRRLCRYTNQMRPGPSGRVCGIPPQRSPYGAFQGCGTTGLLLLLGLCWWRHPQGSRVGHCGDLL